MVSYLLKNGAAALAILSVGAFPVSAQGIGPGIYTVVIPPNGFGSNAFLTELVSGLNAIRSFCGGLQDEAFQVDCLAERLEKISGEIPEGTDYEEVRIVLKQTADKVERLVRNNRDTSKARINMSLAQTPSDKTLRPLTPINMARQTAVNRQAAELLEEATTILLRSAASAQERSNQYTKIASALGSNKVLLRS